MLRPGEPDTEIPWNLHFGSSVAIDGDTLLAGTRADHFTDMWIKCPGSGRPHHFPQYADGCDWVYVFNRTPDGYWVQTAKVTPVDAVTGDTFGWTFDVDEVSGVMVVGNPGEDSGTNTAHIFERQANGSWIETATIKKEYPDVPPDVPINFGYQVAVSGWTVAVSDTLIPNEQTFVFERRENEWVETAVLSGSGPALTGDTLVNKETWWGPVDCGKAAGRSHREIQVFNRIGGEWVLTAHFDPQADHGDRSQTTTARFALDEEARTLVIGAPSDHRVYGVHTEHCKQVDLPEPIGPTTVQTYTTGIGSAWIYELIDGEWVETADIPNPAPSTQIPLFGAAIDISNGQVVIGAHGDPYNGGTVSGTAYIYEKIDGDWRLQARLRNHDSDRGDWFGYSVGISGSTVVVGADGNDHGGRAHLFDPIEAPHLIAL